MNNKTIIIIIVSITFLCLLIPCIVFFGFTFHRKSVTTQTAKIATEQKAKPVSNQTDSDAVVLFEGNQMDLSVKAIEKSSITFTIQNNSEEAISASCHSIAINKVMTQLMIMEDVSSGESKDVVLSLEEYNTICGISKAEDVKNITLDFSCKNLKDEILFSSDVKTFDFGDLQYYYLPADSVTTLHSEKNINISATDFSDNAEKNAERYILIKNNSDCLITAEVLGIFVNDSDLNNFSYAEIYPDCMFYFPVTADGISSDSITKFSLELSCSDTDYNELFHTTITE